MIKRFSNSIIISLFVFALLAFSTGNIQAQPPTPTNFTAGAVTTNSVTFSWTPSASTDSYLIGWLWGAVPPSSPTQGGYHQIMDPMADSYTVTGLQAGQQFSFVLYSRNGGGFSITAETVSATTLPINTTTFTNDQPYSLIIGQRIPEGDPNFNDGGISAHSISYAYDVFSLASPSGGEGKFFVCDTYNNRILIYNSTPTSNNQDADVVVGQPNFTSNGSGSAANQLSTPSAVYSDGTRLYVADQGNNRVLIWNTIPTSNNASADIVLGQTGFGAGHTAANNGGRSGSSLSLGGAIFQNGIATYDLGFAIQLIICDTENDRVLIWNDVSSLYNGAPASVVVGQTNFTAHTFPVSNGNTSTASTLHTPVDAAVTSGGKLVIVSMDENRALIYNSIPSTNGKAADVVLGQTNFSANVNQETNTSTSFNSPKAVSISAFSEKLAIATSGTRILIWNTFPATNNAPAENVLGYADLTAQFATIFSNQKADGFTACMIRQCYGISWTERGNLFVADGSRYSIVEFNGGDNYLHSPSSVSLGSATSNSITLNWSGGAGDSYYIFYRYGTTPPVSATDPLAANSLAPIITAGNSITIEDLPCGTDFSFAVIAQKGFNQFAPVSGTLNASTTSPASCLNFPLIGDGGMARQITASITGDTIFVAGGFSKVYSKSGTSFTRNNIFAFSSSTGNVFDWSCNVDGQINGICIDKTSGKIYIGGMFNNVAGTARKYLASLNSDGTLNTSFAPPSFNDIIGGGGGTCMTLNKTNDTLFFWGQFSNYTDNDNNTWNRHHIAALLTSDGNASAFDTDVDYLSPATCRFFTLSPNGRSLLVGSNSGGMNLNSIDIATGISDFDYQVSGGLVASGWYDGSKYMYFGGAFSEFMGNTNVRRLAKVDMSGASPVLVSTFNNSASTYPGSTVRSMFGTSTSLYMMGDFNSVGGVTRNCLASVSTTDCSLNSWDLNLSNNYSNGTAGNIFLSPSLGTAYFSFTTAPNNTNYFEYSFPLSPSIINGSTAGNVGAGASVNFSNNGGIIAKLSTGTSNLGNTTVTVSGAGGDTTIINGFTVMDRVLTITPTTQPTDNVTVHIYATKAEMDFFSSIHSGFGNAGNNYNGCKIHRLGPANTYVQTFTPTITINGDIVDISFETPGFSSFVMSDDGLLPVELASFTSTVNKNSVTLNWKTSSEVNNSGFDIERKKEGTTLWNKVGNIQGKGTTNEEILYKFEDRNVPTASYKYRLKQIDFNGNYEYHTLVNTVQVGVPGKWDLSQNYPNPFNPTTKINFDIPKESFVKINVYDISGRLVANIVNEKKDAGYFTVDFNASSLASSVYFYRIETESFTMTKKMMLIK